MPTPECLALTCVSGLAATGITSLVFRINSRHAVRRIESNLSLKAANARQETEEFQEFVGWLETVPLLRQQLRRSEFPLVAREVQDSMRTYQPGERLVEQGEKKHIIFFIRSGEADVTVNGEYYTKLLEGDYIGVNTVRDGSASEVTVDASTDGLVEAVAVSRETCEKLELFKKLKFHKRISRIADLRQKDTDVQDNTMKLNSEEKIFLVKQLQANEILQTYLRTSHEDLHTQIAELSGKVEMAAGQVIATYNDFSRSLFVILKGSVEVRVRESDHAISLENHSCRRVSMNHLKVQETLKSSINLDVNGLDSLGPGAVIGELPLLFNTRHVANYQVASSGSATLIKVGREAFYQCFYKDPEDYTARCMVIEHDPLLVDQLFRSQRWELAKVAHGFETFEAGQVVLEQDIEPPHPLFYYIISQGGAVLSKRRGSLVDDIDLGIGDTFGERSAFTGKAEFSVKAGKNGMVCLCIDGEMLKSLGVAPNNIKKSSTIYLSQKKDHVHHRRCSSRFASSRVVNHPSLQPVRLLGKGSFGAVVLMEDTEGMQYAVKRISKGLVWNSDSVQHVCAERELMSLVDSPFVISLHTSYTDAQFLYMVQEAATGGNLWHFQWENPHLFEDPVKSRFYIACVIGALAHLHTRSIVHRDLKPENVILDGKGYAKLCDLGTARFLLDRALTVCGTLQYMAPELVARKFYGFAVDWWALGVLAFQLMHRSFRTPWEDQARRAQWREEEYPTLHAAQCAKTDHVKLLSTPDSAKDFIRKLLVVDPADRLGGGAGGSEDVCAHPWFVDLDFESLRSRAVPAPHEFGNATVPGPAPTLRSEAILQGYWKKRIRGGKVTSKKMTLEQAKDFCLEHDSLVGFNWQSRGSVALQSQGHAPKTEGEYQVQFISAQDDSVEMEIDVRWNAFKKIPDIPFEEYVPPAGIPDPFASFEPRR